MKDRFKFRIPMFTDKGNFQEFQYLELGEQEECTLCGYNGEPQQCTGLKDKNGKLIYEGDIVTYDWLTPIGKVWRTNDKHIVEWHDGFTVISNIAGYDVEHGKTRNVEVIGNIYENPELLED